MIRIVRMIRIAYCTMLTTMTQSINFTQNKQPNFLKDFNKIIFSLPNNRCTHKRHIKIKKKKKKIATDTRQIPFS